MLRDAVIIFQKEYKNVFKDKRAIFANYLLPTLILPLVFFAIGFMTQMQVKDAQERVYAIEIINSPGADFERILSKHLLYSKGGEAYSREVLTIEFPKGYQPGQQAEVMVYSDSTSTAFQIASSQVDLAIRSYSTEIAQRTLAQAGLTMQDVNSIQIQSIDVAPEEAQGSSFLAMLLPYLLLIFIFSGSMAMGMNITAGEKERGGLAVILVNQVSRSSIALGKVFFLVVSALIQATSSALGIIIAFLISPEIMGGVGAGGGGNLLQPLNLISFLLTVLTAGGVSAALITLLGALAKNMKEASGFIMPVYIVVVMVGVATMSLDATENLALFAIPLANLIFMLKGIITSQYSFLQVLITLGANLGIFALLVWQTSRLYNSEKILETEG